MIAGLRWPPLQYSQNEAYPVEQSWVLREPLVLRSVTKFDPLRQRQSQQEPLRAEPPYVLFGTPEPLPEMQAVGAKPVTTAQMSRRRRL